LNQKIISVSKTILNYYDKKFQEYYNYLNQISDDSIQNQKIIGDIYWKLTEISLQTNNPTEAIKNINLASKYYLKSNTKIPFPVRMLENELLIQTKSKENFFLVVDEFLSNISKKNDYKVLIIFHQLGQILLFEKSEIINIWFEKIQLLHKHKFLELNTKNEFNVFENFLLAVKEKNQVRIFNKVKAMEILRTINSKATFFQDLIILTYLELLIDEYRFYKANIVISEVNALIIDLLEIANSDNNIQLVIKIFFLKIILDLISKANYDILKPLKDLEIFLNPYQHFNIDKYFLEEKERFLNKLKEIEEFNGNTEQKNALETLELNYYIQQAMIVKKGFSKL
jgi:hypothetical protein